MSRLPLTEPEQLGGYLHDLHDGARAEDWSTRHVARAFAPAPDLLEMYLAFYYPWHSNAEGADVTALREHFDDAEILELLMMTGSPKIAAAERACKSLLPTYVATNQRSHVVAQALRFSRCMRGQGATNLPRPPKQRRDCDPACHGELAGVPGRAGLLRAQVRSAAAPN